MGIKVLINTKDDNNHIITEYGYILKKIDANLYEIWGESSQIVFLLKTEEFTEISKE